MDCQDLENSEQNSSKDFSDLPKTTFDDVLKELGEFGPYQRKIYILLCLPITFSAVHSLAWVFLGAMVPHRCKLPDEPLNSLYDFNGLNLSVMIPYEDNQLSECSRFDDVDDMQEIPCNHGWIYDKTIFGSSTIIEWNLVCQDQWMRASGQSVFMAGALMGSYIFGKASDKFGRKPTFIFSSVAQALFGSIAGIMPSYWTFIFTQMIIGMATSGVFVIANVLGMEMVGSKYRLFAGTVCHYFFTFGYFIVALVAYFLNKDWRLLQIALSAPAAIFIIYWWYIPESVRWLISKGRYDESKAIITRISVANRTSLSEELITRMFKAVNDESNSNQKMVNTRVRDMLKHPQLWRNCLIMFYIWFVTSGTFFGLILSSPDLGGNPYINFLISAAVEIPANTIVILILNKLGRKIPLSAFLIVTDSSRWTILVILSMIGKLAITICYNTLYVYSAELFPTAVRGKAVGMCLLFSRLGAILCPFLNMVVSIWRPLPFISYGVFAISAGLISLILPETLNKKLPETIEDCEEERDQNKNDKEIKLSKVYESTKL